MSNSGGFSVTRTQSGDRFYTPPLRRQHQLQQQLLLQQRQQNHQQQQQRRVVQQKQESCRVDSSSVELETRTDSDDSTLSRPNSASSPRNPCWNNLDRLMESVTPRVPAQYFSEVRTKEQRKREADLVPFFGLGDLWESYKEWSAYGAGVPLTLNESDSVKQYYVPSLSGMQLYVDKTRPRRSAEDGDAESSKETGSDCETERRAKHGVAGTWSQQNLINLNSQRMNGLTLSEKPPASDESEASNSMGQLIFEYMEQEQPYHRKPLYDKVSSLASRFPEISTYRSCDLLPTSWISVAWYPIYRIPTGPTLQNLDASFLTFHSLSTLPKSNNQLQFHASSGKDAASKISLPVFGLASYKLRGSILTPNGVNEWQQANSLMQSADKFLQSLQVSHPDFQFFASHNSQWRC